MLNVMKLVNVEARNQRQQSTQSAAFAISLFIKLMFAVDLSSKKENWNQSESVSASPTFKLESTYVRFF